MNIQKKTTMQFPNVFPTGALKNSLSNFNTANFRYGTLNQESNMSLSRKQEPI